MPEEIIRAMNISERAWGALRGERHISRKPVLRKFMAFKIISWPLFCMLEDHYIGNIFITILKAGFFPATRGEGQQQLYNKCIIFLNLFAAVVLGF